MHIPRRRFLKTGVLSAVSAGLALTAVRSGIAQTKKGNVQTAAALPAETQTDPVFLFKAETFKPYVGGYFTAPNARGKQVSLKLLSVKTFTQTNSERLTGNALTTDSFSLLFQAEAELPPFTSIHKISHPSLGKFDLFLSPRKNADGVRFYEAVINHIS